MKRDVLISVIVVFFGFVLIPGFAAADKPEGAGKPEWVEKEKAEKEKEKAERKVEKKQEKAEKDIEKAERKAEKEREKVEREIEDQKDEGDDDD